MDEKFFSGINIGQQRINIGHEEFDAATDARRFVFGLQDEGSKININKAPEEALARLFASATPGSIGAELARATVVWRERQEPFAEFGHQLSGNGAGFGSPEELLLVPGMTPATLMKIKEHVTVYGEGQTNLNTVSKDTLVVLGVQESLAERIVAYRRAVTAGEKPFSSLGDLTQKVGVSSEENAQLQNISTLWGTDAETFRFIARVSDGHGSGEDAKEPSALPGRGVECVVSLEGDVLFLKNI